MLSWALLLLPLLLLLLFVRLSAALKHHPGPLRIRVRSLSEESVEREGGGERAREDKWCLSDGGDGVRSCSSRRVWPRLRFILSIPPFCQSSIPPDRGLFFLLKKGVFRWEELKEDWIPIEAGCLSDLHPGAASAPADVLAQQLPVCQQLLVQTDRTSASCCIHENVCVKFSREQNQLCTSTYLLFLFLSFK